MAIQTRVLARLEAMAPSVELEGANVTSSPFTSEELDTAEGHRENFLGADLLRPFPRFSDPADEEAHRQEVA